MTIQEQLRELATYATGYPGTDEITCRAAADRIDALEAVVKERTADLVAVRPVLRERDDRIDALETALREIESNLTLGTFHLREIAKDALGGGS